tara:strand:- start:3041 stop:3301 length:261 start_codon:yes stop_codon:yes gene_type:complete
MTTEYKPVDCGVCHTSIEAWRDRTWATVPIDGNLEKIPFYLHINCVRELHRKSADYVKKETNAENNTTDTKGTVSTTAPVDDTVSV